MNKAALTYKEKLRDPRWQKRRLEIFERDGWRCQCCTSLDNELQVHHKRYVPRAEPWEASDEDLVTLCRYCHAAEGKGGRLLQLDQVLRAAGVPSELIGQLALVVASSIWTDGGGAPSDGVRDVIAALVRRDGYKSVTI